MRYKALAVSLLLLAAACGGKQEREAKYLDRGKAMFEQADYVGAEREFRKAMQVSPSGVEARYYLGLIEAQRGDREQAIASLASVIDAAPNHAGAQLQLAQLYVLADELDLAEARASDVERLRPESADWYALKADIALHRHRSEEALELAERALAKDPLHVSASTVLTSALAKQGEVAAARTVVVDALERRPEDVSLLLLKIGLSVENNRFEDAVRGYRELISLQPDTLEHRLGLSRLYASREQLDDAEAVLREAVAAEVGGVDAKLAIVDLLAAKTGLAQAEAELQTLRKNAPSEHAYAFKLAALYQEHGRTAEAKAMLREIADKDPGGPGGIEALVKLSRLAAAEGHGDEAKALLEQVLDTDPINADALLLASTLALDAGNSERAIADASVVAQLPSHAAPALRLLAKAHLRRDEPRPAMDRLTQLIRIEPGDVVAREQLANLHVELGDLDQALALYNRVLVDSPDRVQSLVPKAEVLLAQKRWAEAEETVQAVLALADHRATGHLLAGRLREAQGLTDAAIAQFIRAHALRPGSADITTVLVQTYMAADRPADALPFLDETTAENPADAVALNLEGEVLARLGRDDEAVGAFRAAIAARPGWEVPHINLGGLLMAAGRTGEGIAAYRDGLAEMPNQPRILFALASAQERSGDLQGAISTYASILKQAPKSDVAANNFAALVADFAFEDKASLARAFELTKKFAASDNPFYLDTLGWVQYRRGKAAKARRLIERAIRLRPDVPIFHYHLGMVLYDLNDREAARQALHTAAAASTDFTGKDEARAVLQSF